MNDKLKKTLIRILCAGAVFICGIIFRDVKYVGILLGTSAYLIAGYDIILRSVKNIRNGQVFDENFLMTIATFGAFYIGEINEGVAVMLLYQLGEWFQSYAVGRSRQSITELMNIRSDYANLMVEGIIQVVDPEDVEIGSTIVVKVGEKVPLDGIVVKGSSFLDTSALTGEAVPKGVNAGDEVLSGYINQSGLLEIKTTKDFDESTVSKILELVENAGSRKARAENFITKFARYYTPVVVAAALCIAFLPVLLGSELPLNTWIKRACSLLVISCPCALVISVPLSFFGGIGGAAREGILIKGGNYIETISKLRTVVFDKTGTLTKGIFKVTRITELADVDENEILKLAALCESQSNHPIAISIVEEAKERNLFSDEDRNLISDVQEISGKGMLCSIDKETVYAGNEKLMELANLKAEAVDSIGTIVYVAKKDIMLGYIQVSDEIKDASKELMEDLNRVGISEKVMLTGDNKAVAEKIGEQIGISKVYAQLLPIDKVNIVEELLENKRRVGNLAFVGDGINDAPVLTRADIGIAMGAIGSDAAIEAADVVIMDDNPKKIVTSVKISRKTIRIVYENIIFALGIKGVFLILGAFGSIELWQAVFADVGVAFIAILNAMRALKVNIDN